MRAIPTDEHRLARRIAKAVTGQNDAVAMKCANATINFAYLQKNAPPDSGRRIFPQMPLVFETLPAAAVVAGSTYTISFK